MQSLFKRSPRATSPHLSRQDTAPSSTAGLPTARDGLQACTKRAPSVHQALTKRTPSTPKQPQRPSGTCPPGHWCLRAHRGVCAPSMGMHLCPQAAETESFPCPCTHPYPRECMCYHAEEQGCFPAKPNPRQFASVVPRCSPFTALGILCFSSTFPFLSLPPFFLPAKTPCHGCLPAPINLLHGLK